MTVGVENAHAQGDVRERRDDPLIDVADQAGERRCQPVHEWERRGDRRRRHEMRQPNTETGTDVNQTCRLRLSTGRAKQS